MPIMMLAMVPYMISILADINALPGVLRYAVYAIPFTHTFMAIPNLMFGNRLIFFAGLIYQIIVFIVCIFFALRILSKIRSLSCFTLVTRNPPFIDTNISYIVVYQILLYRSYCVKRFSGFLFLNHTAGNMRGINHPSGLHYIFRSASNPPNINRFKVICISYQLSSFIHFMERFT